jgi:hypothetical protein
MSIHTRLRFVAFPALLLVLIGCDASPTPPEGGPFGAPDESRLLSPFAGDWVFDFETTLAAQKAGGLSEENIKRLRTLYAENPQFGKMHADMTIKGNEAVCSGLPPAEYRFFAMHEHDGKACGKAWHHEDRFDPGDMSKCYVRVKIDDGRLHFEVRMKDGLPELTDPDLRSSPAVDLDSSANCDADAPAGDGWTDWTTYVFARKS